MKSYMLYLPGAIFLLVVFIRVVLPLLRTPVWKRIIDDARYKRYRKDFKQSDSLLEKAIQKYPDRPEVYIEYFLYHSDKGNLEKKYSVLKRGYDRTKNSAIAFFIGSGYLEDGNLEKAEMYLGKPGCREYMLEKRIPLLVQLYYEKGVYEKAKEEYINFYRSVYPDIRDIEKILRLQSPQELIIYIMILKKLKQPYKEIMSYIPVGSIHTDASWKDYLSILRDQYDNLEPATTGIEGNPLNFNKKREKYYSERIALIELYISSQTSS